jgi:hypothetical protein
VTLESVTVGEGVVAERVEVLERGSRLRHWEIGEDVGCCVGGMLRMLEPKVQSLFIGPRGRDRRKRRGGLSSLFVSHQ